MVSEKMYELGTKKSTIRTIFEFGRRRAAEVGEENIFDFSLGNPNVPPPAKISEVVRRLTEELPANTLHGYTVAPGHPEVRRLLAGALAKKYGVEISAENLFMTSGAAASITIAFKALCEPGDEFVTCAPYFPEYRCFVESVGGKLVVVPAKPDDFQIDFSSLEKNISSHTKALVLNSPNNPSGAVYSKDTILQLSALLRKKASEYGHPIFLISDEPYRELVYDGIELPWIPSFYDDTIICYSYSKSFSLPGERIGYILAGSKTTDFEKLMGAIAGAARVSTHVNAPSLWQWVVSRCTDVELDIRPYERNGKLLYDGLMRAGYTCLKPQGAFYLFPKALEPDDYAFCERAKKYDLLLVPGTDFGCPGYFRAAYCVKEDTIVRALPLFAKLAEEYRK